MELWFPILYPLIPFRLCAAYVDNTQPWMSRIFVDLCLSLSLSEKMRDQVHNKTLLGLSTCLVMKMLCVFINIYMCLHVSGGPNEEEGFL